MKQKIVYSLLIVSIINNGCNSVKKNTVEKHSKSELNWQDSPLTVDGRSDEWDKSQMEFDGKSNIAYKFTNNANNIYVLLITYDSRTQMKILNGGMSFCIDPAGKKEENAVIDYPFKAQNRSPYFQRVSNNGMKDEKQSTIINAGEYVLRGFKTGDRSYSILEKNQAGIQVKIGIDSMNEMVYEAIIPLAGIYNGKNAAAAGRSFSLGFKINGLSQSDINKVMFEMYNAKSQTKMNNMETNSVQILSQTVKIWKNITLASK